MALLELELALVLGLVLFLLLELILLLVLEPGLALALEATPRWHAAGPISALDAILAQPLAGSVSPRLSRAEPSEQGQQEGSRGGAPLRRKGASWAVVRLPALGQGWGQELVLLVLVLLLGLELLGLELLVRTGRRRCSGRGRR